MTPTPGQTSSPIRYGMLIYLLATALICGALVMVIEVLGSRVIGPFFGVSLFVWTSLIAVTLIALALGYAVGGRFADRYPHADYLFTIILIAGLLVLLIPFIKGAVLKLCVPLELRLGAFVSTTLLFGPSLFLLGCVSPYFIRIAVQELDNIGRMVGGFYAVSTVGSVLGTVLTGFVLIGYLSIDRIFTLVGALLILLALSYLTLMRRRYWATAALIAPLALAILPQAHQPSITMDNGTTVTLVASHDSYYGSLKVVDYHYGEKRTREMVIDGLVQGGIDINNGQSVYGYPYLMQFLPVALQQRVDRALVIGMGAGIVPDWYSRRGVMTDVVDIDPMVFEFAERYFDSHPNGELITSDARHFLQTSKRQYDVMVLDVFNGDTTPAHLLSLEAVELMQARLSDTGLLALNLFGDVERNTFMTASVIRTLREIFDQVEIYPTSDPARTDGVTNLAVMAYQGQPRVLDFDPVASEQVHPMVSGEILANLGRQYHLPTETPAIVLTDDYNPIDFFDADLKEKTRLGILRNTEWDILLYSG